MNKAVKNACMSEKESVVDMFNDLYDNYNKYGYDSLKDALMAESNRVIAVQLAKLNDRIGEGIAYGIGRCERKDEEESIASREEMLFP